MEFGRFSLSYLSSSPMKCAICDKTLEDLSESARQAHYETHFSDSPPQKSSQPGPRVNLSTKPHFTLQHKPANVPPGGDAALTSTSTGSWTPLFSLPKTTTKFWTRSYASHTSPPTNYTPNLIPVLRRALIKSHAKGATIRASLCSESVCHIATEGWDSSYGCG